MKEKEKSPGVTPFREPTLAAEAYLICTPAGRVLFASGTLKLMVDEDLTGRNLNDFLEDVMAARIVADALEKRTTEFRCQIRDVWFTGRADPWEDGDGFQILLFPIGTQDRESRSSDRELYVSRNLNVELSVMMASVDLLEGSATAAQEPYLQALRHRLFRLIRMSRNLQDAALAERGDLPTHFTVIDVNRVCRELLQDLEPYCAQKHIVLEGDLPEGAVSCKADERLIKRMILNLVSNAMAAQKEGGGITLRLRTTPMDEVTITVTDRGHGMDQERLSAVYRKHDRKEMGTRMGVGLGLPLVRAFAEAHGGRLLLMSSGEGLGLLAKIILPRELDSTILQVNSPPVHFEGGIDLTLLELSTVLEADYYKKKQR